MWALIHRLLVKSFRICTQGPSPCCRAQQPELCGAQRGDVGAETSPCPTATPNPWEMLSCGEGTLHSTQTVRPSSLDGNGTMCDELLPAFHWLGFFLCNTLSQPPSAKAQQEAWLSAPGYLLSLFVQEMGNSYPHNSVSSRAAHTQVREKEGTSRHWQEHTLEAFLTFSSSWSQNAQGHIQPQLKEQHSSLPYWTLRSFQRDLPRVLFIMSDNCHGEICKG